jgi:hypothetical protein
LIPFVIVDLPNGNVRLQNRIKKRGKDIAQKFWVSQSGIREPALEGL